MLKTSNLYMDAEGNFRAKDTDEVVFQADEEAREAEVGEKAQRRLASTCLPKAAREQDNVVGRISPKLIAASVAKAKKAAQKRKGE
jgi:hypothetical protein